MLLKDVKDFDIQPDDGLIYKDKIIKVRNDGFINATQIASINNKSITDWLYKRHTKQFITDLSKRLGVSRVSLYKVIRGSATWIHPELLDNLINWCEEIPVTKDCLGSLYIYVHSLNKNYRIGWSKNFASRHRYLKYETSSLLLIEVLPNVGANTEQILQSRLSNYRLPYKDKWYKGSPQVLQIWNELKEELKK